MINRSLKGFTLIEVLVAVGILVIILAGLLLSYTSCFILNETTRNLTFAMNAAQNVLEEIREHTFSRIYRDYNRRTFEVPQIPPGNSRGLVEVDNSNPDLLRITITVCWRQSGGRIIGGDRNLNPLSSSPVRLVTLMASR